MGFRAWGLDFRASWGVLGFEEAVQGYEFDSLHFMNVGLLEVEAADRVLEGFVTVPHSVY